MAKPKATSVKRDADRSAAAEQDKVDHRAAYFLSVSLENVRCFGPKQTLDLSDGNGKPARWTIILGVNGTGKTTVLQSLVGFERCDPEKQLAARFHSVYDSQNFPRDGSQEPATF